MSEAGEPNVSAPPKTIGVLFVNKFADWEFGMLSGSAAEWFGARTVAITPDGQPVRSMGGFQLNPHRSADPPENADLDALALIGSDDWSSSTPPDVSALLTSMMRKDAVIGGICAAVLPLARAGLLAEVRHTGNGRDFMDYYLPEYEGSSNYVDAPHAVADGGIISAPGSAPGTFAIEFLGALYPERNADLVEMRKLFAREHTSGS